MGTLNLRQCHMVLAHLLGDRRAELKQLRSAPVHVERFEALHPRITAALDRLAARPDNPVPALVREHMALIATLGKVLDAERTNPLGDGETQTAARVVYDAVVAGRRGPAHQAVERLDQVDEVRRMRPSLAASLALLPPLAGALLDRWMAVGASIGEAVAARTTAARVDDAPIELVRAVMRALGRLRRAIRSERELFGELPRETEIRLLGFADALQNHGAATPKAQATASAAPAERAPGEAPGAALDIPIHVEADPNVLDVATRPRGGRARRRLAVATAPSLRWTGRLRPWPTRPAPRSGARAAGSSGHGSAQSAAAAGTGRHYRARRFTHRGGGANFRPTDS